jgi:ribosomal protein S18 acetylase RimI-like enzyme
LSESPDELAQIDIRVGRKDDLAAITTLVAAAYKVYVGRLGKKPEPMTTDYAALLGEGALWVATRHDDELAGVLVLRRRGVSVLLENIAVAPKEQRRGIGKSLMEFAEQHAKAMGAKKLTLYTNEQMTENIRWYTSLGFVETSRQLDRGFHRVFFSKRLVRRQRLVQSRRR